MTGDSHDNDGYFEGYAMNRFVQAGRYKFYAHLYSDSNSVGTRVDLVYRTNTSAPFTSLYAPGYPTITKSIPISRNKAPSFAEIETGRYSDVRYMAYWDVAPNGSPLLAPLSPGAANAEPGENELRASPGITADQLATVLRNGIKRRAAGQRKLPPPATGLELRPQ